MEIDIKGIVLIVGNYGSGKTEVAINLAIYQKKKGLDVRVADLDLVNPYFRTREARFKLSEWKIDLVLPPEMYLYADLPILTPKVSGMIRSQSQLSIFDVGGNDVGAMVLAALGDSLRDKKVNMLQVVNPFRPFTNTIEGCSSIRKKIEKASKLNINGIIGNSNLIDETNVDSIYDGYNFIMEFSKESNLQVEFITAPIWIIPLLDINRFTCPVLPIFRQLVPPWKTASEIKNN